jgi:methylmalonyl-CoA/ethylmalonyl-CoA epimerase
MVVVHHTGIVVRQILDHYQRYMAHLFPGNKLGPIIHDPLQKAKVAFIYTERGHIELVEPAGEDSPVKAISEKAQAGYHHICLETSDLDGHLKLCRAAGQFIISPPTPAVAFDGRRIAFVMGRDHLLWELLESSAR